MTQEAYVRLPARLRRVVRADDAASALPPPLLAPTPPAPSPERQLLERLLGGLAAAVQSCQAGLERSRRELKNAAVEMAVAVAERFLVQRVEAGAYPFLDLLREGMERLAPEPARIIVRLHPLDLESIRHLQAAEKVEMPDEVTFQPEAALRRGDLRLEAADQEVDLSLAANLARLRQDLLDWAAHA